MNCCQCCGLHHPDADPDPVPDPAYHFDADPDPDFYLMRIRIRTRIRMQIQVTNMMRIHGGTHHDHQRRPSRPYPFTVFTLYSFAFPPLRSVLGIRIRMFLSLPDPNPLGSGTDPSLFS